MSILLIYVNIEPNGSVRRIYRKFPYVRTEIR